MWRSLEAVRRRATCPGCGRRVARDDAREYDKYGDRWDRDEKVFEYFCRPCHDAMCHHGRAGLEALLTEVGAGEVDRGTFLARFEARSEEHSGSVGGR